MQKRSVRFTWLSGRARRSASNPITILGYVLVVKIEVVASLQAVRLRADGTCSLAPERSPVQRSL